MARNEIVGVEWSCDFDDCQEKVLTEDNHTHEIPPGWVRLSREDDRGGVSGEFCCHEHAARWVNP